jgi:mono/diheme cytochrome c family protein
MTPMSSQRMKLVLIAALLAAAAPAAQAQTTPRSDNSLSTGYKFTETDGAALYANVCQGCHMPNAAGATGAGTYPPLAANPALDNGRYPVEVVANGLRGMPAFGDMLSDEQIANVVNYVRTHFGNSYAEPVTADDVKAVRR